MDARTREWNHRKWRVAVARPTTGHINNCRTFVGACYTALVYRVAGWKVKIFRAGTQSLEEAVNELKAQWRQE